MSSQIFCAGRSFAEFAPQGAKKFKSIFRPAHVRTENNYHRASVQAKRVRGGAMQKFAQTGLFERKISIKRLRFIDKAVACTGQKIQIVPQVCELSGCAQGDSKNSSKHLRLDERASAQKRDAKKIAQTELFARNKAIITPAERAERSPRLYRRGTSVTWLYAVCKVDVGAVASETDILPLS